MIGYVLQNRDGVHLDIDVVYCGEYGVIVPVVLVSVEYCVYVVVLSICQSLDSCPQGGREDCHTTRCSLHHVCKVLCLSAATKGVEVGEK